MVRENVRDFMQRILDEERDDALEISINGIAAGMRNTG